MPSGSSTTRQGRPFDKGTDRLNQMGIEKLRQLARRRPMPDPNLFLATANDVDFDSDKPDRLVQARRELDSRRVAAIQRYLTAYMDGRPMTFEVMVHDPFEVLMRTQLGGGTLINNALLEAMKKIEEPRNSAVVLISDFYEGGSNQVLLDAIKALKDSGVHFIPVGAVTSSGYFSVNQWFRTRLKELGTPGKLMTVLNCIWTVTLTYW